MARNANRKTDPKDNFWEHDAEELPRADMASVDLNAKRQKLYRIWVAGSVVLLPIALLAIIASMPKLLEEPYVPPAQVNQLDSPTKAVAMQTVRTWLAGQPAPLPGGQILSWDGVEIQAEPSITVNPDNDDVKEVQGLQLHTMTLLDSAGAFFTTQVQVGYSTVRGAQVIGTPTLMPRAPDDKATWPNLTPWPNLIKTTTVDPVDQAINAWAKAFTSGDPDALRLSVGDQEANRSYVPLSRATASDVRVGDAAKRAPEKGDESNSLTEALPSQLIVSVSFAVSWGGADSSLNSNLPRVSYDVLVDQADTASPKVVAWGGAGTGESLKPFMNAVEGRKITADNVEQAATAEAGN